MTEGAGATPPSFSSAFEHVTDQYRPVPWGCQAWHGGAICQARV